MMKIFELTRASQDKLNAINGLLPQLSSSSKPLELDGLNNLIDSSSLSLFLAEKDGKVLGMLSLVVFAIPTGVRAWIEDVVVDNEARGLGVGKALTNHAVREALKKGAQTIDLTSRPSRVAANQLYQKVGFKQRETNVYRFRNVD